MRVYDFGAANMLSVKKKPIVTALCLLLKQKRDCAWGCSSTKTLPEKSADRKEQTSPVGGTNALLIIFALRIPQIFSDRVYHGAGWLTRLTPFFKKNKSNQIMSMTPTALCLHKRLEVFTNFYSWALTIVPIASIVSCSEGVGGSFMRKLKAQEGSLALSPWLQWRLLNPEEDIIIRRFKPCLPHKNFCFILHWSHHGVSCLLCWEKSAMKMIIPLKKRT